MTRVNMQLCTIGFGLTWRSILRAVLTLTLYVHLGDTKIPASTLYRLKDVQTLEDLLQVVDIPTINHVNKGQHPNTIIDRRLPPKFPRPAPNVLPGSSRQSSEESGEETEQTALQETFVPRDHNISFRNRSLSLRLLNYTRTQAGPANLEMLSLAQMPTCQPRPTVVELTGNAVFELMAENEVDDVIYWPPCVTINRCGGCCSTEILTCATNSTRTVDLQVLRLVAAPGSSSLQVAGFVPLQMVEDETCQCECRVKPEDCHPTSEVYRNCQCECVVEYQCPAGMIWDPLRCECLCNVPHNARTCRRRRHYFNEDSCRCECMEEFQVDCQHPNTLNPFTCKCQSPRTRRQMSTFTFT